MYSVNMLIFKRKKMFKDFLGSMKLLLIKTIKSILFMISGIVIYRGTCCIISNVFQSYNAYFGMIQCLLCSLSSLWEDGRRSFDLALFMYPNGLISLFDLLNRKGYVNELPFLLSLLFSLSLTVVTYLDQNKLMLDNYSYYLNKLIY